jgi:hypothetical protein
VPRIGKHQDAVLNALRMIGPWRPGADNAWNYRTPVETARILDGLASRGLVRVADDGSYRSVD